MREPIPAPETFSTAPLRNRIRAALDAPVAEVWSLIGNFERYPEYAAGVERVDVTTDAAGRCTAYVCHFQPQSPGGASVAHHESVRWFEPGSGYASTGAEPNAFGLRNLLTLVTLERGANGTTLSWSLHFDADDVAAHKAIFDQALADIGGRLIARFGGRIVEKT